jgi:hypothetical protein
MVETYRLKSALRIVDLDSTTFENAVAKGEYTTAPTTSRGAPRLFSIDDLVPLWIFARLIEARGDHARERLSVKEAGKVVRRIHEAMQGMDTDHIAVITHMNDLIRACPLEATELPCLIKTGASSGTMIRDIRLWDIRNVREVIGKAAVAEAQAIGNE